MNENYLVIYTDNSWAPVVHEWVGLASSEEEAVEFAREDHDWYPEFGEILRVEVYE